MSEPEVTRIGMFSMQVCVPSDWTDDQVRQFAESKNPCGTEHGWHVRKEGDSALEGDPARNPCLDRPGCVHIMLDA
jgi:hypothetical protein